MDGSFYSSQVVFALRVWSHVGKEITAKLCVFCSVCLFVHLLSLVESLEREQFEQQKVACTSTEVCLCKRCMRLPVTAEQFHCFITFVSCTAVAKIRALEQQRLNSFWRCSS